jgi:putative flavoprotein involved in K+ transport
MTGPGDSLDVLVIGGGQAGLAVGFHLRQWGVRFLIVDAADEIGASWRRRWDSLRLFTPAQYDNLPGLPFPAARDSYPGKDAVADYLCAYAEAFDMPVRLNTTVNSLTRDADSGCYLADLGDELLWARQVVISTGPFQVPAIPPIAAMLDPGVTQLHSAEYRNPGDLPGGRVLVIGGGNSGCQIAAELSATREVLLSVGSRNPVLPQRLLGRDLWWWAKGVGVDRVTAGSRLGRRLASRDPVFGDGPRRLAQNHGVRIQPRLTQATGRTVTFQNGATTEVDAVVWATGYRVDHSWIDVPGVTDSSGRLQQVRGITPAPGLYTVGLPWQHTRGSALLGWVGADAALIADHVTRNLNLRADAALVS